MQAPDGNEATGPAELMQPDVVLLDLSMPCAIGGVDAQQQAALDGEPLVITRNWMTTRIGTPALSPSAGPGAT